MSMERMRVELGDPTNPYNQRRSRQMIEQRKRLSGDNNRLAQKSAQRKAQGERFVREWINRQSELNLDPKKRFDLAFSRGNNRDVEFLRDNGDDIGEFGYRVEVAIKPASTVEQR